MGASASVTLHPPDIGGDGERFRELLEDKSARIKLFTDIANEVSHQAINFNERISLENLVDYFKKNPNSLLSGTALNMDVIKVAFHHCVKSRNRKDQNQLTKKEFHLFIPTYFLFSKLSEIFDAADTMIDDRRIFAGEFAQLREKLSSISGISILQGISEEEWSAEFKRLDKNKDGYIVFSEFCAYAVKNIINPKDYLQEFEHEHGSTKKAEDAAALQETMDLYNDLVPTVAEPGEVSVITKDGVTGINSTAVRAATVGEVANECSGSDSAGVGTSNSVDHAEASEGEEKASVTADENQTCAQTSAVDGEAVPAEKTIA